MSESNGNGKKLDGIVTSQRAILSAVLLVLSVVSNQLVEKVTGNPTPLELPGRQTDHEKYWTVVSYYDSLGNAARIRSLELDVSQMKRQIETNSKEIDRLRTITDRKN